MINLLSPQKKKEFKSILLLRFLNSVLVGLIIAFGLLLISLLPVYIYLKNRHTQTQDFYLNLSKNDDFNQLKNTYEAVNESNERLKIFPNEMPKNGHIEEGLNKITELKGSQIKIRSFRYLNLTKPDPKSTNIEISGVAVNRNALLEFKQKLESEKSFSNIILPISSFVKVNNIEFNIKLRLN